MADGSSGGWENQHHQPARVSWHARRWYVHVASAWPLVHHCRAGLVWGFIDLRSSMTSIIEDLGGQKSWEKLLFERNLCYHAANDRIRLQE
jgi:hypothetical protein